MGYVEDLRSLVGNQALILVRPSVAIINSQGHILLVKYQDQSWGIPGGLMELGESVEECIHREVKEEIGVEIDVKSLKLFGVYSGKELFTKLRNGHEYYNIIIGYICTNFRGELTPDGDEILEAKFFDIREIPGTTSPYIKEKLGELGPKLQMILKGIQ